MEKEKEENRKRSKITRVLAIVVIILLLLALTVCLIIIFTHRHAMTYYSAAEATCTTDGNAEYWYCAGCNSYFEDENGNNKIERDDVLVSAKGHSWVGESCEAPRHCSVCNYVDGEPLGHDFSEYIFDGNAACTSDGTETATCTRCDATPKSATARRSGMIMWRALLLRPARAAEAFLLSALFAATAKLQPSLQLVIHGYRRLARRPESARHAAR